MILSERGQWDVIEWIILKCPLRIFIDKVSGNRNTMTMSIHAMYITDILSLLCLVI